MKERRPSALSVSGNEALLQPSKRIQSPKSRSWLTPWRFLAIFFVQGVIWWALFGFFPESKQDEFQASQKPVENELPLRTVVYSNNKEEVVGDEIVIDKKELESEEKAENTEELVEEMEKDSRQQVETRKPIEVCTIAKNPRQGSIFRTNLLSQLGSGNYTYVVKNQGHCKWEEPRVRMIPYVKCCMDLGAVQRDIQRSLALQDIVIVTGDEYCAVKSLGFDYRQYYGDSVMNVDKAPLFFPLGPRQEFARVDEKQVKSPRDRRYLINFVGSPTSVSRRKLKDYFAGDEWLKSNFSKDSFIHVTDGWTQKVNPKRGYITPEQYREVLLSSKFTLCPIGHNPEAYRIYEACEAGSIPVVALKSKQYLEHKCSGAFKPFIDSNAPFLYLDTWADLPSVLEKVSANITYIEEKQAALKVWYKKFMSDTALEFERRLANNFSRRKMKAPPKSGRRAGQVFMNSKAKGFLI
mmetsp:Transcript_20138/g.33264  ORF Transcript_20138/g.33264 Transcript_20138/m.33264 type:complete len:466 (-) Transcript_20138:462-1859(-)|eukprot:CAMPEP_0203763306 /NCGR_PEP_ID=MMETSP0098-20131031/16001_1 /ASSEMBLY_ACC=CAM_ASM_000208 /TAXON_ID=96639 /ORGANISM=" , Strain NY0313808BC1" /LENGTH=465 /DNA_ID=CAMNT_0050658005 /DNA_START=210 /DNA_END=1607 /DNA_ORIENTATION=+